MKGDYTVLKIAGGVLLALLIWNALGRYQERKAMEHFTAEMERIAADPDPLGWRAMAANKQATRQRGTRTQDVSSKKPIPPGYRCMDGALLKNDNDAGWSQVTSRDNHWYCPHGGTVNDCYHITPTSVGCQ